MYPVINIFGKTIGTYGLFMVLGFLTAGYLSVRRARKHGLVPEDVIIVGATAFGFAMLFGGLLFVFVTYPVSYILEQIRHGRFDIFFSGIVFYGALVGGLAGGVLGTKIAKCSFSGLVRTVVPFIPLGHALGRIGCLMGGCCYGMEYSGPLAVYYPHSLMGLPADQGYFPVQPLEAVLNVGICLFLVWYEKRIRRPADLLMSYLGIYAVVRFILEFFRGDAVRGIYFSISLSQWISLGLLAVSITGLLWKKNLIK